MDNKVYSFNKKIYKNSTIIAKYTEQDGKEYVTIHFDSAGGNKIDEIRVLKDASISSPLSPKKEGYTFKGWYLENSIFDFNTSISKDITLLAKWKKDIEKTSSTKKSNNKDNQTRKNNNNNTTVVTNTTNNKTSSNKNTINVSKNNINVDVGNIETFTYSYTPEDANILAIGCMSSNNNIAHVQFNSSTHVVEVRGIKKGSTTIVCENSNGGKTYSVRKVVKVNVLYHNVTSIALASHQKSLKIGQGIMPIYNIYPSNATNKKVIWSSSNPSVATVTQDGTIYGKSEGTATIYVKTEDGNKSDQMTVNVSKVSPTSVKIDNCPKRTVYKGDTFSLTATVYPELTTNKSIRWEIDNYYGGAVVDQNGNVTITKLHGLAGIRAISNDNGVYDICLMNVGY